MIGNWKMPLAKNSKKIGFSFYDKIDCFFPLVMERKKTNDDFRRRGARALLRALMKNNVTWKTEPSTIEQKTSHAPSGPWSPREEK